MRRLMVGIVGLLALMAIGLLAQQGQKGQKGQKTEPKRFGGKVVQVVDGDTITVQLDSRLETVRLIGIDAPETNQPFSAHSTRFLKALVEGKTVVLETDVTERDKYGRLLAYIRLPLASINELMLSVGMAKLLTIPPNVRHTDEFVKAQQLARELQLGLWTSPLSLATPQVQPGQTPSTQGQGSDTVYITRTGAKYHRAGCRYLRYSQIPIKRADAIAQGYTPCSVCRP